MSLLQWLVDHGKREEAKAVLGTHHANAAVEDPLIQWELAEIEFALEAERASHQVSYLDFFKTPGNRRRLAVLLSLCIGTNWVGNGIIS